ncbi:membrane metallo-endopeptidase-like 1 [Rhipicephalus microplus]|uniref:membrane metallo-endopeptidase-like 1 n=1 Tax=Rhipicephalus microplus TaxID=6941 RepID=UPI003F6D7240
MPAVRGHSAAASQPDGRGLMDPLRAPQKGQPSSGVGGARKCRSCKSREMGYSYFTSETQCNRESKKARTTFNWSGLESMQNLQCRLPDSTATSPRSRAAFCETTLIAAGFCLFWAAFAIIMILMRERRGASDDNGNPLCQTYDCIQHAMLLANITSASTVDPCDDFSKYVCSVLSPSDRFQKSGGHYASSSAMDAIIYGWYEGLEETLNAGVSHVPIGIKALEMYAACIAEPSRYRTNPAEFLRFLKHIGLSWPEPPPEDVDALSVFVSLTFDFEAPAWFSVDISESRDQKHWRLVISPDGYLPILLVQQRGILKSGGFTSYWRRIWNALVPDVAPPGEYELEADRRAMEDILGKLRGAASSPQKETTPLSLGDIGGYTNPVSSSGWLDALNKTLPLPVTTATEVYITDVGYVRTVGSLFAKYNDRQLVRHLSWLFVQLYGPVADPHLLVDRHGSDEVANASRALFCGSNVEISYKLLVSMLFFVSSISVPDRTLVDACFESLIVTGADKVANSSWLDVDSKLLAGDKIKAVEARVWPDEILVKTNFLERIYEEFPEGRTSFATYWVESRRNIRNLKRRKLYRLLSTQPPSFREPYLSYDATLNRVLFAMSALVRPLLYRNGTKGMLYGGIGFLMALEIVRSLDVAGLRWDPNGNLAADFILSKSSMEEYGERATCYGPERNVSAFPEVPALEVAYAAFQQELKTDGRRYRIGYNFTEEQVFFLTFCLTMCLRRYAVMSPVGTDCNKAVQNFPPFAKTFSCPESSNMNPNVRCRFFD